MFMIVSESFSASVAYLEGYLNGVSTMNCWSGVYG